MNNGKICVSVCAETADELIANIERAAEFADVIELRFDCLKEIETEVLWKSIKKSREKFKGIFLATLRPLEQGGQKPLSLAQRKEFWLDSRVFEFVEWADFEADFPENEINNFLGETFGKIIKSFHDYEKVPPNLVEIYNRLAENAETIKIAVQANDITDSIAVWKLLEPAKSGGRQIIPIAMGEAGKWTRILGLAHGAPLTYAAIESGKETAPGQISARDLIEVYRVKELNADTDVYGILGSNTSVSLSPYIHNAAFKFHRLNAVFVPLQVNDLGGFMRRMVKPETREVELNFKGFSVTIPHKQAIIKHLDYLDETAQRIGAVNTVKIINGKLHGFNTDANGFIEPLKNCYGGVRDVKVAVLGAGGAARACIYALVKEGASVTIFARDTAKAANLAEDFQVELRELANADFSDFKILVNTTPLGMTGKAVGATPAASEQLKNLHLVYDLIYTPFKTRLMTEAEAVGVPTVGGMAMLIAQAMEQQKIWTELDAPMKEMSRAALNKLPSY